MLPGVAASSRTSLITAVLNPSSATVTVYVPGSRTGIENAPDVFENVSNAVPVEVFLTVTVAPGTTPPAVSTTTPAREEFALP